MAGVNVLKGNIANEDKMVAIADSNCKIEYYMVVNKSLRPIIVDIRIKDDEDREIHMCPMNMELAQGESFTDRMITLLDGENFNIQIQGGNADYYISILEYGDNS